MLNQLFASLILICIIKPATSIYWYIEPCRLSTDDAGTLTLCQQKADCATEVSGSTVECSQYTYVTVSVIADCIRVCCSGLYPVPESLGGAEVQQCYNQSQLRKIVLIVCGAVGLFVGALACYVCAFVRNPYTGKLVWVGCCCCRKVPDFQKYRQEKLQSMEKLDHTKSSNVMAENEKKISKIVIQ